MILCSHTRLYTFSQQRVESLGQRKAPFFWVGLDNLLSSEKDYLLETQHKYIRPMELDVSEAFPLDEESYSRKSTPAKRSDPLHHNHIVFVNLTHCLEGITKELSFPMEAVH